MDNLITTGKASDWLGVSLKTLHSWNKQVKIFSILTHDAHSRTKVYKYLSKGGQLYPNKFSFSVS